MTILTGLVKGATDSVGSITPVANIAALRALTTGGNPDSAKFVYVAGHTTAGDGGGGFFALSPGNNSPDDDGLVIVSAAGTFVRQWDKINCYAAWWGYFAGSTNIGPLFKKIPFWTTCNFGPGIYDVFDYPTQAEFSIKFYRGVATIWRCTGPIGNGAEFDLTQIAFDWVWMEPQEGQGLQYGSDATQAGLSPIEGIGIISEMGTSSGVGLRLGGPVATEVFQYFGVRTTTAVSSGKVQFEVLCGTSTYIFLTLAGFDIATGTPITDSLDYYQNGSIYWNGLAAVNGLDPYSAGDVMTIVVDFDAQLTWTRNSTKNPTKWNNNNTANPATGAGGITFAFLPAATPYYITIMNLPGDTTTINPGGSSFVTPLPAGFSAFGASTTFDPATAVNQTLSNGNLTTSYIGGTISPWPGGGSNPIGYMLRPKNFSVFNFYCGVAAPVPFNYFLTGLDGCFLKGNSINFYYNQDGVGEYNSGENYTITDCYIGSAGVDGVQSIGLIKLNFRGCSFDYNARNGYLTNTYAYFENCYFETGHGAGGPTNAELFACDSSAILDFLPGTSFLSTGGPTDGYVPGVNLINFESSTGTAYFRGNPFCDANITRQFLQLTAGQNIYGGSLTGFNGKGFPMCLSPNQLLQNDYLFASGTTFYPGSTCTFSGGSAVFTGSETLQFQTMECQPGDLMAVSFVDTLSGTISGLGGSLVFKTGDGTTVATNNFATTPGVAGFSHGSSPGSTRWTTTARSATLQQFIFRVPSGASKFTGTLTTTGGAGTYSLTSLAIYRAGV